MTAFNAPFWDVHAAALEPPATAELPEQVETLIIGGGYTGISAAIEIAQAGQAVWLLDQSDLFARAGDGCSSRNGGQVGFSLKPSQGTLSQYYGDTLANALIDEALAANHELKELVKGAHVEWQENGTFVGAHTRRAFKQLCHDAEWLAKRSRQRISVVGRAELEGEIESPLYVGGVVYADEASVQPRKLHLFLLEKAKRLGVNFSEHTTVLGIARLPHNPAAQFAVTVSQSGTVRRLLVRQLLIATNGKTSPAMGSVSRWVFPVGSYQLVTEPLPADLVERLIPNLRNVSDTRRVVTYTRRSGDGRRIVFGGRSSALETTPERALEPLRAQLLQVFPQLVAARIEHVWLGHVGFTFRQHPLIGHHAGQYHALGYCGQGIPLACYYGRQVGKVMAGVAKPPALWNLGQITRPYYRKRPWFLPLAIGAYRLADYLGV